MLHVTGVYDIKHESESTVSLGYLRVRGEGETVKL